MKVSDSVTTFPISESAHTLNVPNWDGKRVSESSSEESNKGILADVADVEDTEKSALEESVRDDAKKSPSPTDEISRKRLKQALYDSVKHSQGVVAAETWILNDSRSHLVRAENGWYLDSEYAPAQYLNLMTAKRALARLQDSSRDDYHDVFPTQPGHGLAGQLWSQISNHSNPTISAFGSGHGESEGFLGMGSASRSLRQKLNNPLKSIGGYHGDHHALHWMSLDFLVEDPDVILEHRLESFILAGITQAAGIRFNIRGFKGLVIYFAEAETSKDILMLECNGHYLRNSADYIGATMAVAEPRTLSLQSKEEHHGHGHHGDEECASVSSFALSHHSFAPPDLSKESLTSVSTPLYHPVSSFFRAKFAMFREKTFGSKNAKPPHSMSFSESVWVFIGAASSIGLTAFISQKIMIWKSDPDSFVIPIGPLGALATLQFGLTAAPASQPRNVFYGTLIAGVSSLSFTYIEGISEWLRVALATATAISLMTKLGVTHPPGGALAVLYASGEYHWGHLCLSMAGSMGAVLMAMLVNNLNENRQYPQYWHVNPIRMNKKMD